MNNFSLLPGYIQALGGGLITWTLTSLGSAMVFIFGNVKKRSLVFMYGFAAGVMMAASFWSLLAPSIELSSAMSLPEWIIPSSGFVIGALFLWTLDKILPHLHSGHNRSEQEGIKTNWSKTILLLFAITLHNIPEGLAVGVAFGASAIDAGGASLSAAFALALGIGIQNFPEGAAVSLPLRTEGFSKTKAFIYGSLSGIVEPIAAIVGAVLITHMTFMLPFALAFSAGAMVYVVIEELVPEAVQEEHGHIGVLSFMIGFIIMMILDVALG